jgi:hypothetical protein
MAFNAGALANAPTNAGGLFIIYTGTDQATYGGSGTSGAFIYAPNATVELAGGSTLYGALVAKSVTSTGNVNIYFDQSLQNNFTTVSGFLLDGVVRRVY